jgi:hypothetical protein
MTVEAAFPLTLHFATLYFNKNPNPDEGMYLLQVINFSCIMLRF